MHYITVTSKVLNIYVQAYVMYKNVQNRVLERDDKDRQSPGLSYLQLSSVW